MKRIAIFNSSIEAGDAISNDMLGMYEVLLNQGHEAGLFAEESSVAGYPVQPIEEMRYFLAQPEDIAIYHFATGWGLGLKLLKEMKCRKVIKYHNVTPPHFFAGVNSDYEHVCRMGRWQLAELAKHEVDLYLADSEYNRRELIVFGANASRSKVVPPFHHIDRLIAIEADLEVLDCYNDEDINIVMVGRLVPNKGHQALIEAFAIYHGRYNPQSRLLIVGAEDLRLRPYTDALHQKTKNYGLENRIIFTGKVSDAALKAHYLIADVFLIVSRHEGFCVPLVEAMSMKIPVIAHACTAIPHTVGKTGIVWDEEDPELMAASVNTLAQDPDLRLALGEMGWQRYQTQYTTKQIAADFIETLSHLL
ncbi:MAG: glycosyltransferase family 4 protein [Desulfobacterales bacterium]|nr:MAG: glycosyltransferase family 4 protein [Desulfobacterales bacterium]